MTVFDQGPRLSHELEVFYIELGIIAMGPG